MARLSMQLGKTYIRMSYPNTPESTIYETWGGERNFLQILGVYLIVEKGLDLDADEYEFENAINEITNRTFWWFTNRGERDRIEW